MMKRDAQISDCGRYRYKLEREWHPDKPALMFLMLNPSVADHNIDDRTIRRCIGFAQTWGYGALWVGNLFAFRSPHPQDLLRVADPVGEFNDRAIMEMADQCELVVAGWGTHGTHNERNITVRNMLAGRLHALKITKEGHPQHPLYIPKTTVPFHGPTRNAEHHDRTNNRWCPMTIPEPFSDLVTLVREVQNLGASPDDESLDRDDLDENTGTHLGWAVSQSLSAVGAVTESIRDVAELGEFTKPHLASITDLAVSHALATRSLAMAAVAVGMDDMLAAAHYVRTADDLILEVGVFRGHDITGGPAAHDTSGMSTTEITRQLLVLQSHRAQASITLAVVRISVEIALMLVSTMLLDTDDEGLSEDARDVLERGRKIAERS